MTALANSRSNYRLMTLKDGVKSTSYPFIIPEPGIYQIITDMGFSTTIDPFDRDLTILHDFDSSWEPFALQISVFFAEFRNMCVVFMLVLF